MRVAVCGATGRTGRHLVGQARERGWEVTALDREPGTLADGVSVHGLDVADAARLAAAVDGADAVISVIAGGPDGDGAPLHESCTRSLVAALGGRSVRLVYCSSAAIDAPEGDPWLRRHVVEPLQREDDADVAAAEAVLRSSDVDWVVVRAGRLHDRPALGAIEVTSSFRPEVSPALSRADLARFLLDQVTGSEWVRRTAHPASPWD